MDGSGSRYDTVNIDGLRVRGLRKAAKLTQQRLASLAGVSRGYVAIVEGRESGPVSQLVAEAFSTALGVQVDDLKPSRAPSTERPPAAGQGTGPTEPASTIQAEVDAIIGAFSLPQRQRMLARRMILEVARVICGTLKENSS